MLNFLQLLGEKKREMMLTTKEDDDNNDNDKTNSLIFSLSLSVIFQLKFITSNCIYTYIYACVYIFRKEK